MELFTETIAAVRNFMEGRTPKKTLYRDSSRSWPRGGPRNIVLKEDLGLELGNPEKESVSCLLWTEDLAAVIDGRITLAGPDFPESRGQSLPFGKVVLAGVTGFNGDNAYERHKDLDYLRYSLDLKGFMLRAVSQFMREWCRIGTAALTEGFDARVLGSALMDLLCSQPYVKAVEVFFLTAGREDVLALKGITSPAEKIIGAMNKMASEMDFECSTCDYQDVCDEAVELKSMRKKLMQKKQEALHV